MSASNPKMALWENVVLRLIAIYKLLHAVLFIAVGFGLLQLRHHDVVQVLNTYVIGPYHLHPEESSVVDWVLDMASTLTSHKLTFYGYTAFLYAALFAAEGIGLYLRKHWAEYLVVIVTGSLLPFEIYKTYESAAPWKFGVIAGNLLVVSYLIHRLLLDSRNAAPQKSDSRALSRDVSATESKQAFTEVP
jgi:uncharacterized membrane protein (DUF2068 family)